MTKIKIATLGDIASGNKERHSHTLNLDISNVDLAFNSAKKIFLMREEATKAICEHFDAMLADPRVQACQEYHKAMQALKDEVMSQGTGSPELAIASKAQEQRNIKGGRNKGSDAEWRWIKEYWIEWKRVEKRRKEGKREKIKYKNKAEFARCMVKEFTLTDLERTGKTPEEIAQKERELAEANKDNYPAYWFLGQKRKVNDERIIKEKKCKEWETELENGLIVL